MPGLAEKYRPKRLDEVVGQDEVVSRLRELVKKGYLPHMLFYGPPGCGKTSTAYALANEVGLPVVELNASDERGIQTIREKVKSIAMLRGRRIILLDEADNMTEDAQQALRRIMERGNATFILTANDDWKIIDPIKSRCVIFRFSKLSKPDMLKIVVKIIKAENVKVQVTPEFKHAIEFLLDYVQGDLRKAINMLEPLITSGGQVNVEAVKALIPPDLATTCMKYALDGQFEQALKTLEDAFIYNKLDAYATLNSFYDSIRRLDAPIHVKLKLYDKLAEAERGIKIGCSPLIQLAGFVASCYSAIVALRSEGVGADANISKPS